MTEKHPFAFIELRKYYCPRMYEIPGIPGIHVMYHSRSPCRAEATTYKGSEVVVMNRGSTDQAPSVNLAPILS